VGPGVSKLTRVDLHEVARRLVAFDTVSTRSDAEAMEYLADQAHQANESIGRDAFERGPGIVRAVGERLCMGGRDG